MATFKVKNGPAVIQLEEVVIGSQLPMGLQIMEETTADVFVAMDLTNVVITAHVKDNVKNDIAPDFQFAIVKRNQITEKGWVDLTLSGTITGQMTPKDWHGSVKIHPTGFPELGTTVAVIEMPVVYRATR